MRLLQFLSFFFFFFYEKLDKCNFWIWILVFIYLCWLYYVLLLRILKTDTLLLFLSKRSLLSQVPWWRTWPAELTCTEQMLFGYCVESQMEHFLHKLRDTWNRLSLTKTLLLQVLLLLVEYICFRCVKSSARLTPLWSIRKFLFLIANCLADKPRDCKKVE